MLLASEFQFAPSPTTPFPKLAGRFLIAVDVQLAIPGFLGAMAGADEYVSKVHTDNKITGERSNQHAARTKQKTLICAKKH